MSVREQRHRTGPEREPEHRHADGQRRGASRTRTRGRGWRGPPGSRRAPGVARRLLVGEVQVAALLDAQVRAAVERLEVVEVRGRELVERRVLERARARRVRRGRRPRTRRWSRRARPPGRWCPARAAARRRRLQPGECGARRGVVGERAAVGRRDDDLRGEARPGRSRRTRAGRSPAASRGPARGTSPRAWRRRRWTPRRRARRARARRTMTAQGRRAASAPRRYRVCDNIGSLQEWVASIVPTAPRAATSAGKSGARRPNGRSGDGPFGRSGPARALHSPTRRFVASVHRRRCRRYAGRRSAQGR